MFAVDLSPLWVSLHVATLATAIATCVGLPTAYWLYHRNGRGRLVLETLLVSPLVLPPTVVGFLLLILLSRNSPLGQFLGTLGIAIVFTRMAAAMAASVVAFPLLFKSALGAFEQIDPQLLWAARTLGASEWRVFRRVALPLAGPGIVAGTVLAFARALGEFGATLMLAGNIPGKTQTLPMAIYFAVEAGDTAVAWGWSLVMISLALGAIGLGNVWRSPQRLRHCFKPLDLTEPTNKADSERAIAIPAGNALPVRPIPSRFPAHRSSSSSLSVRIYKQLTGFSLDVAFDIQGDRPFAVLGASGAGKSLLLRCLAGIDTPDEGRIVLNGRTLFDSAAGVNLPCRDRRLGLLFQQYALFPHLTVADNIALGVTSRSHRASERIVRDGLAAVGLHSSLDRYPAQLSGGQQQRAALIRALVCRPELLLLDEPLSALDAHLRRQVEFHLLSQLSHFDGLATIVTHNLNEAYRLCDRMLVLENGRAIAEAPTRQLFANPETLGVARLTGCENLSVAYPLDATRITAMDWDQSVLQTPIPDKPVSFIGIRAHHLAFPSSWERANTVKCWPATTVATPHSVAIHLKLHRPPSNAEDYTLQATVLPKDWVALQSRPLPWPVHIPPDKILLLSR